MAVTIVRAAPIQKYQPQDVNCAVRPAKKMPILASLVFLKSAIDLGYKYIVTRWESRKLDLQKSNRSTSSIKRKHQILPRTRPINTS
jgi:hypothetical protein